MLPDPSRNHTQNLIKLNQTEVNKPLHIQTRLRLYENGGKCTFLVGKDVHKTKQWVDENCQAVRIKRKLDGIRGSYSSEITSSSAPRWH